MLRIPPPDTNNERQRRFLANNPGYYNKYRGRQRAQLKRDNAAFPAKWAALQAQVAAQQPQSAAPATRPVLMLPAPAEIPVITGLNAPAAILAQDSSRFAELEPLQEHLRGR